MKSEQCMSCIDCAVTNCNHEQKHFPDFCLTTRSDPETLSEIAAKYQEPATQKAMIAAAEVEYEGYCQLTRVQEIIEYAKKCNMKKLGIATCVGLISESRTLAKILRHHGFEVYGVACKVGTLKKSDLGIPEKCNGVGTNACNPIMQAHLLDEAQTDLNIVVGLCVGHDSLFYKHSAAPVTTAVTKDRVLGHNPAAALYQADAYYNKKLFP